MPQMEPRIQYPHIFLKREPVKNRPDSIIKEEIEPVETSQHAVFDYGKAVQLFRQSMETDRRGKSREIETEFQNRIIRYMLHKPTSQIQLLLKKICTEAQRTTMRPELKLQFITQERKLLSGIEAVIDLLRDLELQFHQDKQAGKKSPSSQLFLGTNDRLDAKLAIDVIAIEYELGQIPKIVELHQIKSKTQPAVSPGEIKAIQEKHADFVKTLSTRDYATSYMWSREILKQEEKKLNEFLLTYKENETAGTTLEITHLYDDLMVAILAEPPTNISEDSLEDYLKEYAPNTSLHALYTLFHQKFFEKITVLFNNGIKLTPEQQKTAMLLHSWCLEYVPSLEKIQAVLKQYDITFNPNDTSYITQDVEFWSVIDHAGKPIRKRL